MLPILIVDNAREDLILQQRVIRKCRIVNPIYIMNSGTECIRYFREVWFAPDGTPPAPCLLLLDLKMVPVSGVDVLGTISKTNLGQKSVVVMLSGSGDMKMIERGYELGAKTFFLKPFTNEDVLNFLESAGEWITVTKNEDGLVLKWKEPPSGWEASRPKDTSKILSLVA